MSTSPETQVEHESEILRVLETYTHTIRSIIECAAVHIEHAETIQTERMVEILRVFESSTTTTTGSDGKPIKITIQIEDIQLFEEFRLRMNSPHSEMLARSLLIYGFSAFDAFLGKLLRALYKERPVLVNQLEEKTVKLSDLIECESIESVLEKCIEHDTTTLLRGSYDEVFRKLAARNGLDTITKFDNWPKFIEHSQRRNLVTHCDGVVNTQYLDKCNAAKVKIPESVKDGTKLGVSLEYLTEALEVLYEVGVMLTHTLWRKACPGKSADSEKALNSELFNLLRIEKWTLARQIGYFTVKQTCKSSDLINKIIIINYSQALKWGGSNPKAIKVLGEVDWSGAIGDLRLAVAVIREDYDDAVKLMRSIGKKGDLVDIEGYRHWPVFREFRKTKQFTDAFESIYSLSFTVSHQQSQLESQPQNNPSVAILGDSGTISIDVMESPQNETQGEPNAS